MRKVPLLETPGDSFQTPSNNIRIAIIVKSILSSHEYSKDHRSNEAKPLKTRKIENRNCHSSSSVDHKPNRHRIFMSGLSARQNSVSPSRMECLMDFLQVLPVNMGVDLGGLDIRVA